MITDNWVLIIYSAFVIVLAILLINAIPMILYYNCDYSTLSDKNYFQVRNDKGSYGEYLIFRMIDKLPFYKQIIINAYITKEDKNDTEIDIIMICTKGIFVFESKNYSGLINGNEKDYKIKQILGHNVNYPYNPILQNRNHIKHLNNYLKGVNPNIFHSIIVFGDNSDISKFTYTQSDYILIKTSKLVQDIDFNKYKDILSFNDINNINSILLNNVFVSEKVKQRQIQHARDTQNAYQYPTKKYNNSKPKVAK